MKRGRSAELPLGANLRCFIEPGRSPALRFMDISVFLSDLLTGHEPCGS